MLKKLPPLYAVTIILVLMIIVCILYPCSLSYYAFIIALLIASVMMVIHLLLAWPRLAVTSRLGILLSIVAWLGLFYGLVHASGLKIFSYFS